MIDLENTIDSDDEPDGSEGGYTRHGNYIVPDAMREIVCLRREVKELRLKNQDLRERTLAYADERNALRRERDRFHSDWRIANAALADEQDKVRELRRELDGWRMSAAIERKTIECERDDGVLNIHPEDETCGVCEPTWLPAPDSKPPELADAQMVELCDGIGRGQDATARDASWYQATEYRPLYSDSGLPLCSPEGLQECARFVATDSDGSVWQFSSKPIFGNHYSWGASSGAILQAPSSHRKGRCCSDSLMEVMR